MRYNVIIKHLALLSIIIILFSGAILISENESLKKESIKPFHKSTDIKKVRYNILSYENGTATFDNGEKHKVSKSAEKDMILKKVSNIYINTSTNEIIKIEFAEL